jgi:hypothetical protein
MKVLQVEGSNLKKKKNVAPCGKQSGALARILDAEVQCRQYSESTCQRTTQKDTVKRLRLLNRKMDLSSLLEKSSFLLVLFLSSELL